MFRSRPSPPGTSRRRAERLAFGLAAFAVTLWLSATVFERQWITGDEGSYLFQSWNFIDGKVHREVPPTHTLMQYDMILLRLDSGWVSRYSPGHPLWLIPGALLGWPHLMSALGASLTVMAGYEIGHRLKIPRFLLPALFLLSPFFLLLHGTFLSHTSGMTFSSGMLLFYIAWRQDRRPVSALFAGLCWAMLFLNRTWTSALISIPFAADSLIHLWKERENGRVWCGTVLFASSALLGVALYLGYNYLSTGDARLSTYLYYEPSENLGFGPRRLQGGPRYRVEHTVERGFRLLWRTVRELDRWMLGTPRFTLLAWLGLAGHGWNRRWSGLLLACVGVVFLGYVAFWYPGIRTVGPLYQAEVLPHLFVLGSLGLSRIWRRSRPLPRTLLFALLAAGTAWSSLTFISEQKERIQAEYGKAWAMERIIQDLPDHSLVFIYNVFQEDRLTRHHIGLNERGMDSRVLRLRARPSDQPAIAAAFPDRRAFVFHEHPEPRVEPFDEPFSPPTRPGTGGRAGSGSARNEEGVRVAAAATEQAGFLFYGWYPFLPPGEYEARFELRWRDVREDAPVRIEVMTDLGRTTIVSREIHGSLEHTVLPFSLPALAMVEPRVHFGGSGTVELRHIEIRRRGPPVASAAEDPQP